MAWQAPAARAGVLPHQMPDCSDRPTINNTAGCIYTQRCSSRLNYRFNFDNPGSKKPQRRTRDFEATRCDVWNRLPLTPRTGHTNYRVCRYCIAAIERQPWHRAAENDFRGLQPHNSTSNSTNHFLTRLCGICEEREIQLLNQRTAAIANNAIAPVTPSQAVHDRMEEYPDDTCTCKKAVLDTLRLCLGHRRQHYDDKIPRLNAQRDANRAWLRSIERVGNRLVRRTGAAQLRELNDRRTGVVGGGPILLRACRCGEDPIDDIREARVLQCMSCEGIVHVIPVNQPQAYYATREQLRHNSQTAQWKFRLRRLR
jgi:hypothetical protein